VLGFTAVVMTIAALALAALAISWPVMAAVPAAVAIATRTAIAAIGTMRAATATVVARVACPLPVLAPRGTGGGRRSRFRAAGEQPLEPLPETRAR
jgi:hypothetical protein